MKILKSIIESIKDDAQVNEVLRGLHWTAVVSKHCGLASSMITDSCHEHEKKDTKEGSLTDLTAKKIAEYCFSDDSSNASLGMAAVNSLIRPDISKCSDVNGISFLHEIAENKNISVIGHFPGLDNLAEKAKNFWIIEKHPKPGDFPKESSKKLLPQSDILIISSTTLMNHTLENLLGLCKKNSIKMLLGPSTPMTEVLFEYGIDILSGSMVTDQNAVLKYIKEGANFIQIKKSGAVHFVTMFKDRSKFSAL
jgi:uncharacterized protein (DUF4213/DUF364 family)